MALEATHIQFALDLKDRYQIQDVTKYLSGTIYPDSRYVSGIDRKLTHHDDFLLLDFLTSDFHKGWAVHIICDKAGMEGMNALFPEFFSRVEPGGQGTDQWVRRTAIKIIQDMEIFRVRPIESYLPMLDYAENPNDESIESVKQYNEIIQRMYRGKKEITVADAGEMWLSFGIEEDMVNNVLSQTNDFLSDVNLTKKIYTLYDKMLTMVMG